MLTCLGALLAGCGINLPDHTPAAKPAPSDTMKAG